MEEWLQNKLHAWMESYFIDRNVNEIVLKNLTWPDEIM